jgi:hypothetical protein
LNEKLVTLGEAALGGQMHEEFFDVGLHRLAELPSSPTGVANNFARFLR